LDTPSYVFTACCDLFITKTGNALKANFIYAVWVYAVCSKSSRHQSDGMVIAWVQTMLLIVNLLVTLTISVFHPNNAKA